MQDDRNRSPGDAQLRQRPVPQDQQGRQRNEEECAGPVTAAGKSMLPVPRMIAANELNIHNEIVPAKAKVE